MESARWNLHNEYAQWNAHDGIRTMECPRWNPHNVMRTMECARWNAHDGMPTMKYLTSGSGFNPHQSKSYNDAGDIQGTQGMHGGSLLL